ncbi:hypothetical protein GCM10027399_07450 [Curvibacter fontanus]
MQIMASAPITEKELRCHVIRELTYRVAQSHASIYEELVIEQGASRVDIALVGDILEAFELKSDFDDFGRLHNQIHAYNRVFDRITLVTGLTHAQGAIKLMPSWWGIWAVGRHSNGDLVTEVVREAGVHERQESRSLAMFLWRDEAAHALTSETGAFVSKKATKSQLHDSLAAELSLDSLRIRVSETLRARSSNKLATRPQQSGPNDGLSRPDASCSDFHCLI